MKKSYKIPFNTRGNLIDYVDYSGTYYDSKENKHLPVSWKDNYIFSDSFEYEGYSKGRSACHIYLRSSNNNNIHFVLISDFDKMMKRGWMKNNKIIGKFTFAKRGANFMMVPIFEENTCTEE